MASKMSRIPLLDSTKLKGGRLQSPLLDLISRMLPKGGDTSVDPIDGFNADYLADLPSSDDDIKLSGPANLRCAPSAKWYDRLFGKRWRPVYIALWRDSALLSFKSKGKFSLWSRLRGRDRKLGKANACIDLETIVSIREIDGGKAGRCLELCTFDGRRIHLAIPDESFDAWCSRLNALVSGNNLRTHTYLVESGQGSDKILLRDVSDVSSAEIGQSTLATFSKLVDLKRGVANARTGHAPMKPDRLQSVSQFKNRLSPLLKALSKLLPRSSRGGTSTFDDNDGYLNSVLSEVELLYYQEMPK